MQAQEVHVAELAPAIQHKPKNKRPGKNQRGKPLTWGDRQERVDNNAKANGIRGPGAREVEKTFTPGAYPDVIKLGLGKPGVKQHFTPDLNSITASASNALTILERTIRWTQLVRRLQDTVGITHAEMSRYMLSACYLFAAQRISQSHQAIGLPNLGLSVIDKLDTILPKGLAHIIEQIGEFEIVDSGTVWRLHDPVVYIKHLIRAAILILAHYADDDLRNEALAMWFLPTERGDVITRHVLACALSGKVHVAFPDLNPQPDRLLTEFFSGRAPWWWQTYRASLPVARMADLDWLWSNAEPSAQDWGQQTCWDLLDLPNFQLNANQLHWNTNLLAKVPSIRDSYGEWAPHLNDAFRTLTSKQSAGMQGSPMQIDVVDEDVEGFKSSKVWITHNPAQFSMGFAFPIGSYSPTYLTRHGRLSSDLPISTIAQSWLQTTTMN